MSNNIYNFFQFKYLRQKSVTACNILSVSFSIVILQSMICKSVKKKKAKMGLLMNSVAQGLTSSTVQPQYRNPEMMKSALAEAMQNSNNSDFVLQAPDKRLPNYLKCKIYFFETKKNITIEVMTHPVYNSSPTLMGIP